MEFPINQEGFKVFSTTAKDKLVLFRYSFTASSIATKGSFRLKLDE